MVLFACLGTWQVMRLEWKTNLIHSYQQGMEKAAYALTKENFEKVDENQKISVKGRYLHNKSIFLTMKTRDGKVGMHLLTPFKSDFNSTFWVNRGWVPQNFQYPLDQGENEIIESIIVFPKKPGYFTPKNNAAANQWFYVDLEALSLISGIPHGSKYYLELLGSTLNSIHPVPIASKKVFKNNHLGYAITWFSLCVLVLIYALAFGRKRKKVDDV